VYDAWPDALTAAASSRSIDQTPVSVARRRAFLTPPRPRTHTRRTRTMQIHIKKLDGQKEEFSLEPNDSVMKVKVRV
jgi:hypothetical protein